MDGDNKPAMQDAIDSIVLEEEIDPNYVPSEPEVVEYAKWMGMDLDKDQDLFWIAREGLMAPLPKDWKPCKTKDTDDIYYFNFTTGDSTWDHPCDGYYKRLYEEEKKKKETVIKESGDQNRSKAKQDVEQLLGKGDKKKSKKAATKTALGNIDMVKALPAPLGLQKAPLPGISNPLRMSAPAVLGPLGGGGGGSLGGGELLGSLSRSNSLLRKGSDMDMKASSSIDIPRSTGGGGGGGGMGSMGGGSSRDPSPAPSSSSSRGLVDTAIADYKTSKQRGEQKEVEKEGDGRGGDSDVERRMGRLNVTASLSSQSRTLGGGGQASKLRTSLPDQHSISEWQDSPADEKLVESNYRYDYKPPMEEKFDSDGKNPPVGSAHYFSSATSAPPPALRELQPQAGALDSDLTYYKSKCTDMEKRVEELEVRVADYKTSYSAAKDDLLALERRYESNQSQWLDRHRALEVEKDKIEGERRQLKLTLLDLESAPKPPSQLSQPSPSVSADESTKLENEALTRKVTELNRQLQVAEAALARSAASHSDLQQRMQTVEFDAQSRAVLLEARYAAAASESGRLAELLVESKRAEEEARLLLSLAPVGVEIGQDNATDEKDNAQGNATAALRSLADEKDLNSKKDIEIQQLKSLLLEEQHRSSDFQEQLRVSESKRADAEGKCSSLEGRLVEVNASLLSATSQLSAHRSQSSSTEAAIVLRAEAAEAELRVAEAIIADLRALESSLRRDVCDREKRMSDQQEQFLAAQASLNLTSNSNSEKERSASFASQATAIRKSLKTEIEKQKSQIQDLETEKSALVTKLTRNETALQFAQKELNGVAALKEASRQLEAEKQQLSAQLESLRGSASHQSLQELEQREKIESLSLAHRRAEEGQVTLRQEVERLTQSLVQEKIVGAQSEKKIKSYQEELLQLQRRQAEKVPSSSSSHLPQTIATAAQLYAMDGSTSTSSSPVQSSSAAAAIDPAIVADLQQQVAAKQVEVDRLTLKLQVVAAQSLQSQDDQMRHGVLARDHHAAQLADLQQQLDVALRQVSTIGADHFNLQGASLREKDELELDKLAYNSQIMALQTNLTAALSKSEFAEANIMRLENEVKNYRLKFLASENELNESRLSLNSAASVAESALSTLRAELREVQASAAFARATEESLREQLAALKAALDEKDGAIRSLRAELQVLQVAARKEHAWALPVQSSLTAASSQSVDTPEQSALRNLKQQSSTGQDTNQHIVALSLEVGRQQATMERLEQHIRNTEVVLQEIKSLGSNGSDNRTEISPPSEPSPRRTEAVRPSLSSDRSDRSDRSPQEAAAAAWDSSTPDSQQSLLVAERCSKYRTTTTTSSSSSSSSSRTALDLSSSPARKARNKQKTAAAAASRSVQFQFGSTKRAEKQRQHSDRGSSASGLHLIDLKDCIASLVEELDMDVHDCTTLRGLTANQASPEQERLVFATAQRVLIDGKARLKLETKFLKQVQVICSAAKESISCNQEYVKNLKSQWRSAKNDQNSDPHSGGVISTEAVNSVTLKVNGAVDDLREAQQLTQTREHRLKSLHQSVLYLEQLLEGRGQQQQQQQQQQPAEQLPHLVEVMQLVQKKCLESAADLEALTQTFRSKNAHHHLNHPVIANTTKASSSAQYIAAPSIRSLRREEGGGATAAAPYGVAFHEQQREQQPQHYQHYQNLQIEGALTPVAAQRVYQHTAAAPPAHHLHHHSSNHSSNHSSDHLAYRHHTTSTNSGSAAAAYAPGPTTSAAAAVSASVSTMRNSELKSRLLQEQISKITQRQSLSKEVCERHAGWLCDLGKEITAAASHGNKNNGSSSTTTDASSLQQLSSKWAGGKGSVNDTAGAAVRASRSFGTALHNQQQHLPSPSPGQAHEDAAAVDSLMQKL